MIIRFALERSDRAREAESLLLAPIHSGLRTLALEFAAPYGYEPFPSEMIRDKLL